MPAKSGKQYRFMQAAAHGGNNAISPEVAEHFVHETPKSKRKAFSHALMKKKSKGVAEPSKKKGY